MKRLLIIATLLIAACAAPPPTIIPQDGATPTATPAPTAIATPDATPDPTATPTETPPGAIDVPITASKVTVKGTGSRKTKPFTLPLNDYTVAVSGTCKDYVGNIIIDVDRVGGDGFFDSTNVFNEIAKRGKYKWDTEAYGLGYDDARVYIDATMCSGPWVVTFTTQ